MTKGVPAALAYRLWCSFKRRWILMLIFIAIPIILSGLFMVIKAKGLITKSSAKMEGPIVHPPITKSDIMGFGLEYTPIAVSPNNSDTRRLIELVAQTFEKSGLTFGPAEFFDTDILAAKYMADMAKKSAFSFSNGGFGIHFSQLSPTKLEYTLRSIHTQGWYTTMGYPSQMIPGPMDNGQFYFAKGFAPLQLIINDAYSQSTLNVSLPNWEIQPFPYPMYEKQDDYALLYMFMEMMNTFGLTFLLSKFSTMLITEKASGIKELLKLNGVKTWMIYASWYNMFGLISALIALIVTIFWKYPVATGAVLPWTNPFILFVILVSYYWNALASVGFISSLITEPKYGMMFTVLYWIGSNTLVNTVLQKFRNRTILIFLGLLPNGAIYGIMEAIAEFEAAGSGATFSNLYSSPPVQTLIFPIGVNLALMLLSSIIYLTLMAYVDAIKPGPFGRARPWHFIFPKFSKVNSERTALLSDQRDPTSKALIEDVGEDTPVGLQIVNVLKVFGSLRAVDNLSVTIYKNQITALLGHNGAGKSTLFSMICGMFSPTSGSVYTGDFDVFQGNNLELFRRQLGFCPQHDLLIDELTVEEHLLFFGMVKGLTREEAKVQSDHWTDKFKLREGRHKRVAELSGGMKRKLCISIALVGNPQYLLLDEPTSGLDPESRRDIWDVLLLVRGNRTIVISTHFMEEADVLGDRIAIVAHGTLKCYGTGMFLKKHYGSGYQLNVTLKNDEIVRDFLEHVKQLIPEAAVMKEAGRSFSIGLPAHDVRKFPEFFRMIESRYGAEIESSLSCTNMDDVFLKVQESEGVQMTIDEVDMPTMLRESHDQRSKRSAISRVWQQCEGFFIKRFMWAFYNWPSFIFFMIACPALGMYVNMSGCNQAQEINSVDKLILSLTEYPESIVLVNKKAGEDKLASVFESLSMKSGSTSKQIQSNNITKDLLDMAVEDLLTYRSKMVVAFDNSQATPNVLYSTLAYHSIPIAIEMLYNSLLRNAGISATISASSYPYNFSEGNCQQGGVLAIQTVVFWIMFAVTMLVTTSYFIMFPHTERITYLKHLQIMTGAQPVVYWLTNFIADFTLYIIPLGVSLLFLVLFDSYKMYEYCIFYGALILVLLLYGMGGILAAYFASYFLKSYTSAMELYLFLQNICAVISLVGSGFETTEWFPYVFYLLPWIPFARSISKLVDWAAQATLCFTCQPGQAALCKLFIDQTTFKTFDMKMELIYLAVDPFVYLALILAIDHGIPRMMLGLIRQVLYGKIDESGQQICDLDVASEKETVDAARGTNQDISSQTIFVCDDLGKKYSRSFTAVYDVTFGVQKGECFGLLGVNGAGKSTTFAMLTGSTNSTKGDSRLMKYSLKKERHNYLKGLGYCPQLDGLLLELSARTLLKLFGRLRGIPPSQLDNITQKWIDALDMTNICDRPCKEYSGGNKRKLSTAMALIADPPVVLLDEPTTGVDPVVRRKIWSILKYCREKNGQTIIITSHSMDECEAVCGRLTIMVKGQMKCIGTIPRLKKVYGRGCILLVKFGFRCSPEQEREVQIQIEDRFNPYISLQDKQHGLFNYHINSDSIKLYTMFETMNSLKTTYPVIEDFSLSDISLEQVFLSLAKGRDASPSTK